MDQAKLLLPLCLLTVFWIWETWIPLFGWRTSGRVRHAVRNLAVGLTNSLVMGTVFGAATIFVAAWTTEHGVGLLNLLPVTDTTGFILALIVMDAWMYLWHRANHSIPLLWRFHRMHHSDTNMDVTTAARFHLGEHVVAATLRLVLIAVIGLQVWHIVLYDSLVLAMTQFHHADISLGRLDRWLRVLIVTPDMHKIHHSHLKPETDSNYSTVLSIWDRIAVTFRMRENPRSIEFGLDEFQDAYWQTIPGMLSTPLVQNRKIGSSKIERCTNN